MEIPYTSGGRSIALIELDGPAIRYAGVRTDVGSFSLFRLGVCEFDFDVESVLFGDEQPNGDAGEAAHKKTLTRALDDVFGGTTLSEMRVVVHPGRAIGCYSLTPLEADQQARDLQFREEISLLADVADLDRQAVTVTPATKAEIFGAPHRWHHLLYVEPATWGRVKGLGAQLGLETVRVIDSSIAAAEIKTGPETSDSVSLFVGVYPGRTEISARMGGRWLRSHHGAIDTPEDIAYYALDLLRQVGFLGEDVNFFGFYGKEIHTQRLDLLASFFSVEPRRLDPFDGVRENVAVPEEEAGAFVPLVGAAGL